MGGLDFPGHPAAAALPLSAGLLPLNLYTKQASSSSKY